MLKISTFVKTFASRIIFKNVVGVLKRVIIMAAPIVMTSTRSDEASVVEALKLAFVVISCHTLGLASSEEVSFSFL